MGSLGLTRTGVIVICLIVTCTTITNAQLKKSHRHQEEVELNVNEGDITAKDNSRLQTVEGKVKSPSPKPTDWHWHTRVLIDGGRRGEAFLREDGSFSFIASAGSYLIEVVNPDYRFEPVRVDITAKGKVRARMVNNIQPSQVTLVRR